MTLIDDLFEYFQVKWYLCMHACMLTAMTVLCDVIQDRVHISRSILHPTLYDSIVEFQMNMEVCTVILRLQAAVYLLGLVFFLAFHTAAFS